MNNEIIKQIKKKMIDKDMNQAELAKKIDINSYQISNLLNGKTNPTIKTLTKVLDVLDLKINIVEKNENIHS